MKKIGCFIFASIIALQIHAQTADQVITRTYLDCLLKILSSDDMEGRAVFTPGIDKAAFFIESEFKKIGLKPLKGEKNFRQTFYEPQMAEKKPLFNIVGIIPGQSKPQEFVIFSAHYDHLGMIKTNERDRIANGADDNASGVAAVLALAKYYKSLNNNARTLIFVAFTAEETGGFGAQHFSKKINPSTVVAMFNIEMIGKESKFGRNSAFITGYEKSDLGPILQKNLAGTTFTLHPDPYPEQNLFYRSDNATFAALGIPAHTISTDKIDVDTLYHTVKDEYETLNVDHVQLTIQAIAKAAETIIKGIDTPCRIKREED